MYSPVDRHGCVDIENYILILASYKKQNNRLKQENEHLRKENQELKQKIDFLLNGVNVRH